ncbi:MAG: hypothetical protein HC853_17870 [Anaerolineae bacterium]|nr:hypothetical protein [Anaerolineae bacterium]
MAQLKTQKLTALQQLQLYINRQASSTGRYILEQGLQLLAGGIPTVLGVACAARCIGSC